MESLIPFLAMIAYAIITWYLKKKQSDKDADRTSSAPSDEGKEWDELLEALGQKPSKKPPEPVKPVPPKILSTPANYPHTTPPPIFKRTSSGTFQEVPAQPVYTPPRPQKAFDPDQLLDEEMKSLEETMTAPTTPLIASLPPLDFPKSRYELGRINKLVRERKTLKDAVILNEVLQPPLALRP